MFPCYYFELWFWTSCIYNGFENNVCAFACTQFLPDGNGRKIWGQGLCAGSCHHSDILHRSKDASHNHTDLTCHQRGKWPGRRLANPSQPFSLLLFCLSAISLRNQFQYVGWYLEEHCPAGTQQRFTLALNSVIVATFSSSVIHLNFRNDMATKEVQAQQI